MTLTRDSVLFSWLAVVAGTAGYLATGPSPVTWDFQHWMQLIVVVIGFIAAKLGTSPIQGTKDALAQGVDPRQILPVVFLALVLGHSW